MTAVPRRIHQAPALSDYRANGGAAGQAGGGDQGRRFRRSPVRRQHPRLHPVLLQPGRCYWLKVYEAPQGSRTSRGKPIVNLFPWRRAKRSTPSCRSRNLSTTSTSSWPPSWVRSRKHRFPTSPTRARPASSPWRSTRAITSIGAELTNGQNDIVLVSNGGKAVWFDEDVRPMAQARGVRHEAAARRR